MAKLILFGREVVDSRIKLNVFQVHEANSEQLCKLIESLGCEPGYSPGYEISEEQTVPGLYQIEEHRGEITDRVGLARVVENQIWTGKFADMIAQQLIVGKLKYDKFTKETTTLQSVNRYAKPFQVR